MIVLLRHLEGVAAVDIMLNKLPLLVAVDLNNTRRVGACHTEESNGTCSMRVAEDQSIKRGTHDIVSVHPDPRWLQHIASRVLIGNDFPRFMVHTPI